MFMYIQHTLKNYSVCMYVINCVARVSFEQTHPPQVHGPIIFTGPCAGVYVTMHRPDECMYVCTCT
jgi:hypothetical protein